MVHLLQCLLRFCQLYLCNVSSAISRCNLHQILSRMTSLGTLPIRHAPRPYFPIRLMPCLGAAFGGCHVLQSVWQRLPASCGCSFDLCRSFGPSPSMNVSTSINFGSEFTLMPSLQPLELELTVGSASMYTYDSLHYCWMVLRQKKNPLLEGLIFSNGYRLPGSFLLP